MECAVCFTEDRLFARCSASYQIVHKPCCSKWMCSVCPQRIEQPYYTRSAELTAPDSLSLPCPICRPQLPTLLSRADIAVLDQARADKGCKWSQYQLAWYYKDIL